MNISSNYMEELRAAKFRFQDLKIWQSAIEISNELFNIADELETKKLYRFAEQLRVQVCQCLTISLKARVPHQKRILKIS
jgi:hypothetical protein